MTGKQQGQTYCSRFCYLLAMDQTHVEEACEWCGETFRDTSGQGRRYCSRSCATAARFTPRARRGSRCISHAEPEEWLHKLTEAARASGAGKRGKRRTQSGTYPWPQGQPGSVVELNEREFAYLLSKSIRKKCCDN